MAKQQQLKADTDARSQSISVNLTSVDGVLRQDYAELDAARTEDKATLLSKISQSVRDSTESLLAELSRVKSQLSDGLMTSITAANQVSWKYPVNLITASTASRCARWRP